MKSPLQPQSPDGHVCPKGRSLNAMEIFGVTTTKIYCRSGCPSRTPKPENIRPFSTWAEAEAAGFRACKRCDPKSDSPASPDAILRVCRYLEQNSEEPPRLETLAEVAHISKFHLLRTFRRVTGMTPRAYANLCRLRAMKLRLKAGQSVTRAMYEAGYGSSSRVYEQSARELGMTPRAYADGGRGETLNFHIVDSALGRMLVAATAKGVAAIYFGDDDAQLQEELHREYPRAEVTPASGPLVAWTEELERHVRGEQPLVNLPLDLQATVFQRRVWDLLQRIPYGETRTYSEIAAELGQPGAVRAVASACATNPVSVAVPCHRVLRNDGSLGGYRWGLSRKVQLLETERRRR